MSYPKINWEPYGSMHFGYLGERDSHGFSYIIQGPDRGMYALHGVTGDNTFRIEEFPDVGTAQLAAEKMEESKC
jgi:hypothetical protein